MAAEGFRPAPWLTGAHAQTIVPFLLPTPDPGGLPLDVQVAPGTRVRVLVARPPGPARGTVLLLHGLDGSADSGYMRRTASEALRRGWVAARMNLRNCGRTEALARTLYNAAQSDDAGSVLEALEGAGCPRPFVAAGFSLGGNLVLRYGGLSGGGCVADAIVGVGPPIDLAMCLGALERPVNALYHLYFAHGLCAQIRRIRRHRDVPGPPAYPWTVGGVRHFDDLFTAPDAGFRDSADYYAAASAGPALPGMRRPALVLAAADDPLVPLASFAPWHGVSPRVRFAHPSRGGHVGYWQSGRPRFWGAAAILDFAEDAASRTT